MASKIKVDQIEGQSGTTVTLPSGQTLDLSSGSVTLPNNASSASVPIGMWHQLGDLIDNRDNKSGDKGIFMQVEDIDSAYRLHGTEMTIANPKWILVDADHIRNASATTTSDVSRPDVSVSPLTSITPHFPKQKVFRRVSQRR